MPKPQFPQQGSRPYTERRPSLITTQPCRPSRVKVDYISNAGRAVPRLVSLIKYPAHLVLNPRLRREREAEKQRNHGTGWKSDCPVDVRVFPERTIDGDLTPEICLTNYFRFSGRSWSMIVEHLDHARTFDGAHGMRGQNRRAMACTQL